MVFSLKAGAEVYSFYRQVCSVNQDAESFFSAGLQSVVASCHVWLLGLGAVFSRLRQSVDGGLFFMDLNESNLLDNDYYRR